MKVFVWEYVGKVSDNYHEEGGLLVVAHNEERAKELITAEPYVNVTEDDWKDVIIIDALPGEKERLITFPDAGCC